MSIRVIRGSSNFLTDVFMKSHKDTTKFLTNHELHEWTRMLARERSGHLLITIESASRPAEPLILDANFSVHPVSIRAIRG